jgi:UPF0271 protein
MEMSDIKNLKIDMNSDVGEGFGAWGMGDDGAILASVSSANIACGYHAGDPSIMRRTVELCAARRVGVGAHVSYPDLSGFGRRDMALSPQEVYDCCLYQIGAICAFCRAAGTALRHVKPHGALYNRAAKDRKTADAIVMAAKDSGGFILLGLANSEMEASAKAASLPFAKEAFADRAYMSDGTLMPRSMDGSVIHDAAKAADRAVRMACKGMVVASDGSEISFRPDSICLHGDTPEAVGMALAVRRALAAAGVEIRALGGL